MNCDALSSPTRYAALAASVPSTNNKRHLESNRACRHGHRTGRLATEHFWRGPWRLAGGNLEIRDWKLARSCLAETYSDGRRTKQHLSACWMRSLRQDLTRWIRLTFIPNGCREIKAGSPRRSSGNG